jgi:hypothetical protein
MTELDEKLQQAYQHNSDQDKINKVYTTFFRTNLYMPITRLIDQEEPFVPYYVVEDEQYFVPVFDTAERLQDWAEADLSNVDFVQLSGMEVLRGVGEAVFLCLNVGTKYYKEFSPEEVARLKLMIAKIDSFKKMGNASAPTSRDTTEH